MRSTTLFALSLSALSVASAAALNEHNIFRRADPSCTCYVTEYYDPNETTTSAIPPATSSAVVTSPAKSSTSRTSRRKTTTTTTTTTTTEPALPSLPASTFTFAGKEQTYVVPEGVTMMNVRAYGAGGGSSRFGEAGGKGGFATGNFSVTPNQTLYISVGAAGYGNGPPGYGGGGQAGSGSAGIGASGGGLTAVWAQKSFTGEPIALAAGGGGAGGRNSYSGWCPGGDGGGETGASIEYAGWFAGVGSQVEGTRGRTSGNAWTGSAGGKYTGASAYVWNAVDGGGGGGGGYFGGGGGWNSMVGAAPNSGGGGGSSYIKGLINGFTKTGGGSLMNQHGNLTLTPYYR